MKAVQVEAVGAAGDVLRFPAAEHDVHFQILPGSVAGRGHFISVAEAENIPGGLAVFCKAETGAVGGTEDEMLPVCGDADLNLTVQAGGVNRGLRGIL